MENFRDTKIELAPYTPTKGITKEEEFQTEGDAGSGAAATDQRREWHHGTPG